MDESSEKRRSSSLRGIPARIREEALARWKTKGRHLPSWMLSLKEPKWQRWALIVVTAFFSAFLMAPTSLRVYHLVTGEPAPETIISPITFQVIDEAATNKNRDEALKSVLPVYDYDDEMVRDVQARIISAFTFMQEYLAREEKYREREKNKTRQVTSVPNDKAAGIKPFRPLDE
ncbi:MAG: hypothetical protein P8182_18860, partial [Deltaproteobacteria bacterium]